MNMPVIENLTGCFKFLRWAYNPQASPEYNPEADNSGVHLLPNGADGLTEMGRLYESRILAGQDVCFVQIGQTTAKETGDQAEMAKVFCNMIIGTKTDGTMAQFAKLQERDRLWDLTLEVVGRIKKAADWYVTNTAEKPHYEISIEIDRDSIEPVGKMANGITVGWYFDIDISFPVNEKMYPE